jgi:co-chaperonin GroES (HSP10)
MKLKAIYNAVIVKPVELEESRYGSIIVPDMGSEKNKLGEVISVGEGLVIAGVGFTATQVKVGQKVVLPTMGFTRFEFKGDEYFIGPENQLLAVLTDTDE